MAGTSAQTADMESGTRHSANHDAYSSSLHSEHGSHSDHTDGDSGVDQNIGSSSKHQTATTSAVIDILSDGNRYTIPDPPDDDAVPLTARRPLNPRSTRFYFVKAKDVFASHSQLGEQTSFLSPPLVSPTIPHSGSPASRQGRAQVHSQMQPCSTMQHSDQKASKDHRDGSRGANAPSQIHQASGTSGIAENFSVSGDLPEDDLLDETKHHNDEDWKWYRGGFSIDPTSVFRAFASDPFGVRLRIGANLMFETENQINYFDGFMGADRSDRGHTLSFDGPLTTFFTIPNMLRVSQRTECNALEVELVYLQFLSRGYEDSTEITSPLEGQIRRVLLSGRSAAALFNGDLAIGARLLMFDVLCATVACWIDFLRSAGQKSAWQPRPHPKIKLVGNFRPLFADREYVTDFVKCGRDLLQAAEIVIKMIEVDKDFVGKRRAKFDHLLLYHRLQHDILRSTMKDVEGNMQNIIARTETMSSQDQAATVKRLTLVASIFLPLTTACSLLSMNNRVSNLGVIWWDWLGIVVVIGCLIVFGYRISAVWYKLRNEPWVSLQTQRFKQEWRQAKLEVLRQEREKNHRQSRYTDDDHPEHNGMLIPTVNMFMFRLSKYLLTIGAVVSFLIGMFVEVSTGAEVLGYSVAATVLVTIGVIVIWRVIKAMTRTRSDEMSSAPRASKSTKTGYQMLLFCLVLVPLGLVLRILGVVLWIFLGRAFGMVLKRVADKFSGARIGRARPGATEPRSESSASARRQADDIESSPSQSSSGGSSLDHRGGGSDHGNNRINDIAREEVNIGLEPATNPCNEKDVVSDEKASRAPVQTPEAQPVAVGDVSKIETETGTG